MRFSTLLSLFGSLCLASVNEPPDGTLLLGAWLQSNDSAPGLKDGDRPTKLNYRTNFYASFFQYAQNLPIGANEFPFPEEQIDETNSDAMAVLTVYPIPNPWAITDADIKQLTDQCARLNNQAKRRLLIRFAPEMNGYWTPLFPYQQQPSEYVALWRRVSTAIKASCPTTGLIWSPNFGTNYPYRSVTGLSAENLALMDTNQDGIVNNQDDSYAPFYPGDEYVDWVGLSVYTFGSVYPWSDNIIAPPGRAASIIDYGGYYQTYAVKKNKPFFISETGAAFHVNTPLGPGVGELATKQSWWRQLITNNTFLDQYPKIKAICLFEFAKFEETFADGTPDFRDFRVTSNMMILKPFLEDLKAIESRLVLATDYRGATSPGIGHYPPVVGSTNPVPDRSGKATIGNSGSSSTTKVKIALSLLIAIICMTY